MQLELLGGGIEELCDICHPLAASELFKHSAARSMILSVLYVYTISLKVEKSGLLNNILAYFSRRQILTIYPFELPKLH